MPSVGNFLYVETGADANELFDRLLHEGIIVRPLAGFGSPTAIRISVGTPEELDLFAAALGRVLQRRAVNRLRWQRVPSLRRAARAAARPATSGCSSSRRSAPGVGTWMATIALTADVTDAHALAVVGERALHRHVPAVGRSSGSSAGPLVDRLSRKRLIVTADLVRLVVFVALPFVDSALAIIVLAAVAGVANSFFRPAVLAGVPNLVAEDDLAHGTSLLQATDWVGDRRRPDPRRRDRQRVGPASRLLDQRRDVPVLRAAARCASPRGLLQSEQAITRGHWRDLADGLRRVPPLARAPDRARRVRASRCSRPA